MSFDLSLRTASVDVDPGVASTLEVEIANRSSDPQQMELEVLGLDHEWVAIPVPVFVLAEGEAVTHKVVFKPPRVSESIHGEYPFTVRVRSLETGEAKEVASILHVKPFHHLSMELSPKRGRVGGLKRGYPFSLTVMNLGNTDHTAQLTGTDPQNMCAFSFDQEQIPLTAGQQVTIGAEVSATTGRLLANPRLYGFTITGRSVNTPNVACAAQGQLEQRALFSPGSFVLTILCLMLAIGWWTIFPKAPRMETLVLSTREVPEGEPLKVSWSASHAANVELYLDDRLFYTGMPTGTYDLEVDRAGVIKAVAVRDGNRSHPRTASFEIRAKERAAPPAITAFDIVPAEVEEGQALTVRYSVGPSVTKLILEPVNTELNLAVNEREIVPNRSGEITYILVASNADGQQTKREFKVNVKPTPNVSLANIWKFDADPKELGPEGGDVVLTWEVYNTVKLWVLENGIEHSVPPANGAQVFQVTRDTTFILKAADERGREVTKSIDVKIRQPDVPPPTASATTGGSATSVPVGAGGGHR